MAVTVPPEAADAHSSASPTAGGREVVADAGRPATVTNVTSSPAASSSAAADGCVVQGGPQVHARDLARDGGAPLVYLDHGGADAVRSRVADGQLVCPVPSCPAPRFVVIGGSSGRRHHFRHRSGRVNHSPAELAHTTAIDLAGRLLRSAGLTARQQVSFGAAAVDLVVDAGGGAVAVTILYDGLSAARWRQTHADLLAADVRPVWLVGHLLGGWMPLFEQAAVTELTAAIGNAGLPVLELDPYAETVVAYAPAWRYQAGDLVVATTHPAGTFLELTGGGRPAADAELQPAGTVVSR